MKFIEVNGTIINTAFIVKIEQQPYQDEQTGDVNIHIHLANGEVILDPEVHYNAMLDRWDDLKNQLGVE
jgi:hypothetical protein